MRRAAVVFPVHGSPTVRKSVGRLIITAFRANASSLLSATPRQPPEATALRGHSGRPAQAAASSFHVWRYRRRSVIFTKRGVGSTSDERSCRGGDDRVGCRR